MLTYPVKGKEMDMVLSGEMREMYREVNKETRKVLEGMCTMQPGGGMVLHGNLAEKYEIRLRSGSGENARACVITCWIDKGYGLQRYGAQAGVMYYRLHITGVKPL